MCAAEVSHFGFAWIVACGLTGVGIGIHAHGAELQAVELASAVACALLSEKNTGPGDENFTAMATGMNTIGEHISTMDESDVKTPFQQPVEWLGEVD